MKKEYKKITLRDFKKFYNEIKIEKKDNTAILIKLLYKYMNSLDVMFCLDIITIDTALSVSRFCSKEIDLLLGDSKNVD